MHSRPILLLSPLVGSEISNSLQLSLGQSLNIIIKVASSNDDFLKQLIEDDKLIKIQKLRLIFCFVLKKSELILLKKLQTENRDEQTIVVLDSTIKEIRVWDKKPNRVNCTEIANIDAISTAVNLAFFEYQETQTANQNNQNNINRNSTTSTSLNNRNQNAKNTARRSYMQLASPEPSPTPTSITSPIPFSSPRNSTTIEKKFEKNIASNIERNGFTNQIKIVQNHASVKNNNTNNTNLTPQKELDLLDFSDMSNNNLSTMDDFFPSAPIFPFHSRVSKTESSLDFEKALGSINLNDQKNNLSLKKSSSQDFSYQFNNSFNEIQNNIQPPKYRSQSLTNSQLNNYNLNQNSHSLNINQPLKSRQINFPKKSDIEHMKNIQRNSKEINIQEFNHQLNQHEKETFKINEMALLDFDFAFEEVSRQKGVRKSESYDNLNRDFRILLDKEGVSSIINFGESHSSKGSNSESISPPTISDQEPLEKVQIKKSLSPEEKRAKIIYEIFKEECTYVESILMFQSIFVEPLKKDKLISESLHHLAFSDFPVIYCIHNPIKESMEKLYGNVNPINFKEATDEFIMKFVTILRNKAPAFKLYSRYFSQTNLILNSLKEEQDKNQSFRMFLEKSQESLREKNTPRQTLTSYFQQILQHLARYPLTLQRLLDNSVEKSLYYKDLESVLETIKGILRHCNQKKKDADLQEVIISLEKETGISLQEQGRRLIKYGEIIRTKPTKKYAVNLYLFNDMIVMKDLRRGLAKQKPKVLNVHHNLKVGQLSPTSFFIFDCYYQKNEALTLFFEEPSTEKTSDWVNVSSAIIKNRKKLKKYQSLVPVS